MKLRNIILSIGLASILSITPAAEGRAASKHVEVMENTALEYWADSVGDQNITVSRLEEDYLEGKLEKHGRVYAITTPPANPALPPEFGWHPLQGEGVYASKKELGRYYRGIPFTRTGVLQINRQGQITGSWTFEGDPSKAKWQQEKIPNLRYDLLMEQRRMQRYNPEQ